MNKTKSYNVESKRVRKKAFCIAWRCQPTCCIAAVSTLFPYITLWPHANSWQSIDPSRPNKITLESSWLVLCCVGKAILFTESILLNQLTQKSRLFLNRSISTKSQPVYRWSVRDPFNLTNSLRRIVWIKSFVKL